MVSAPSFTFFPAVDGAFGPPRSESIHDVVRLGSALGSEMREVELDYGYGEVLHGGVSVEEVERLLTEDVFQLRHLPPELSRQANVLHGSRAPKNATGYLDREQRRKDHLARVGREGVLLGRCLRRDCGNPDIVGLTASLLDQGVGALDLASFFGDQRKASVRDSVEIAFSLAHAVGQVYAVRGWGSYLSALLGVAQGLWPQTQPFPVEILNAIAGQAGAMVHDGADLMAIQVNLRVPARVAVRMANLVSDRERPLSSTDGAALAIASGWPIAEVLRPLLTPSRSFAPTGILEIYDVLTPEDREKVAVFLEDNLRKWGRTEQSEAQHVAGIAFRAVATRA